MGEGFDDGRAGGRRLGIARITFTCEWKGFLQLKNLPSLARVPKRKKRVLAKGPELPLLDASSRQYCINKRTFTQSQETPWL